MRWFGQFLMLMFIGVMTPSAGFAMDGAAAVQSEVQRALDRIATLDPTLGFAYGAVEVVPEGSAFGVTVADVSLRFAANDPGYLDVGWVSFRLSPADGNLYRVDRFQAASSFPHRHGDGRVDSSWAFVNRELSGLWSRRQAGFLRREAVIDVSLAVTGLDAVIAAIASAPPQAGSDLRWLQLMLFKGLARREAGADGGAVDHYDISLSRDGPAVVNGRQLDFLSPAALSTP